MGWQRSFSHSKSFLSPVVNITVACLFHCAVDDMTFTVVLVVTYQYDDYCSIMITIALAVVFTCQTVAGKSKQGCRWVQYARMPVNCRQDRI